MDDKDPPPTTGVSEQKERSRSVGRPEYKPTDDQRALVRRMAGEGASKSAMALAVGVSRITLRKHFSAEIGIAVEAAEPSLLLEGAHVPDKVTAAEIGRPEFEPTYGQRQDVRLWVSDDWSEERMARQLGIARNTLRKHFVEELQHGADTVRAKVLRDLDRASSAGKVAASSKILAILDKVTPPPTPKGQADEEPLGKKAQAKVDAGTAEQGTSWADLVH